MKNVFRVVFFVCWLVPAALFAAEVYDCQHIAADGKNQPYRKIADGYARLTVDGDTVVSRVRLEGVSKEVTFISCARLPQDGSNFSRWFAIECKKMKSADGGSVSFDPYLLGAYAGVSPRIDHDYPLFEPLKTAAQEAGVAMPERTFVIYAGKKPQFEFFCNRREERKEDK